MIVPIICHYHSHCFDSKFSREMRRLTITKYSGKKAAVKAKGTLLYPVIYLACTVEWEREMARYLCSVV